MIKAIFACDEEWGIGKNGALPWPHNPEDLKWFKQCTDGDVVVMGRKTWESLPRKPLPNRINYVVTSDHNIEKGYYGRFTSKDVGRAIRSIIEGRIEPMPDIWIIGGAQLFESCIDIIEEVHLSRIEGNFDCDVFLPKWKLMRNFYLDSANIHTNKLNTEHWKKRQ